MLTHENVLIFTFVNLNMLYNKSNEDTVQKAGSNQRKCF